MRKKVLGSLSTVLLILGVSWIAFATNGVKNNFNTYYASQGIITAGSAIDQCILCHATNTAPDFPSTEIPPNPYGVALENNGSDFAAAEPSDSDGDGFTNIAEISAKTFPGDPASKPTSSGTTPPVVDFDSDGSTDITIYLPVLVPDCDPHLLHSHHVI